jgi:hypothetical protein
VQWCRLLWGCVWKVYTFQVIAFYHVLITTFWRCQSLPKKLDSFLEMWELEERATHALKQFDFERWCCSWSLLQSVGSNECLVSIKLFWFQPSTLELMNHRCMVNNVFFLGQIDANFHPYLESHTHKVYNSNSSLMF